MGYLLTDALVSESLRIVKGIQHEEDDELIKISGAEKASRVVHVYRIFSSILQSFIRDHSDPPSCYSSCLWKTEKNKIA